MHEALQKFRHIFDFYFVHSEQIKTGYHKIVITGVNFQNWSEGILPAGLPKHIESKPDWQAGCLLSSLFAFRCSLAFLFSG